MANKTVCIDEIRGCEGNCITMNDYRVAGPKPWGSGIVVKNWVADVDNVIRALRDNDVVKVVHGRWKYYHKQNIAVCTNCSFERDLSANFGKAISCPNCGAHMMDGGNEDA